MNVVIAIKNIKYHSFYPRGVRIRMRERTPQIAYFRQISICPFKIMTIHPRKIRIRYFPLISCNKGTVLLLYIHRFTIHSLLSKGFMIERNSDVAVTIGLGGAGLNHVGVVGTLFLHT